MKAQIGLRPAQMVDKPYSAIANRYIGSNQGLIFFFGPSIVGFIVMESFQKIDVLAIAGGCLLFLGWIPGLIGGIFYGVHRVKKLKEEYGKAAAEAFQNAVGSNVKYQDVNVQLDKTVLKAFALAHDGNNFWMMDQGLVTRFTMSDVRSWSWEVVGADTIQLHGRHEFSASVDVAHQNAKSILAAELASGFNVSLKDIDNPSWHFGSVDERLLKRWSEIFKQCSEMRLAA